MQIEFKTVEYCGTCAYRSEYYCNKHEQELYGTLHRVCHDYINEEMSIMEVVRDGVKYVWIEKPSIADCQEECAFCDGGIVDCYDRCIEVTGMTYNGYWEEV